MNTKTHSPGTKTCTHLSQQTVMSSCPCGHCHHDNNSNTCQSQLLDILNQMPYALRICEVVKPGHEQISDHPSTPRPTVQGQQQQQQKQKHGQQQLEFQEIQEFPQLMEQITKLEKQLQQQQSDQLPEGQLQNSEQVFLLYQKLLKENQQIKQLLKLKDQLIQQQNIHLEEQVHKQQQKLEDQLKQNQIEPLLQKQLSNKSSQQTEQSNQLRITGRRAKDQKQENMADNQASFIEDPFGSSMKDAEFSGGSKKYHLNGVFNKNSTFIDKKSTDDSIKEVQLLHKQQQSHQTNQTQQQATVMSEQHSFIEEANDNKEEYNIDNRSAVFQESFGASRSSSYTSVNQNYPFSGILSEKKKCNDNVLAEINTEQFQQQQQHLDEQLQQKQPHQPKEGLQQEQKRDQLEEQLQQDQQQKQVEKQNQKEEQQKQLEEQLKQRQKQLQVDWQLKKEKEQQQFNEQLQQKQQQPNQVSLTKPQQTEKSNHPIFIEKTADDKKNGNADNSASYIKDPVGSSMKNDELSANEDYQHNDAFNGNSKYQNYDRKSTLHSNKNAKGTIYDLGNKQVDKKDPPIDIHQKDVNYTNMQKKTEPRIRASPQPSNDTNQCDSHVSSLNQSSKTESDSVKEVGKLHKQTVSKVQARTTSIKLTKLKEGKYLQRNNINAAKKYARKSDLDCLEDNRKSLYKGNANEPNALTLTTSYDSKNLMSFKLIFSIDEDQAEKQPTSNTGFSEKSDKQPETGINNVLIFSPKESSSSASPVQSILLLRTAKPNKSNVKTLPSSATNTQAPSISQPTSVKKAAVMSDERFTTFNKNKEKKNSAEKDCQNKSGISTAEQYHRAFQRLKQEQTEGQARCTSCGRAECNSENLQSMKQMLKSARENGYQVHDVTPDGNCMFAAVVDQLHMYGDNRYTAKSLREAAVVWLLDNPYTESETPKSEFLSEDWPHYIERMGREGEWGDHMILGAIVEVVDCTIRVMSPADREPHWTTLEPQGTSLEGKDKHLILGHIGEFHYTSLRPTITGALPQEPDSLTLGKSEQPSQFEREEDSIVEVFHDTYICEESHTPVLHLTYLLKMIIPIACLDRAAVYMSEINESMLGMTTVGDQGYFETIPISCVSDGMEVPALIRQMHPGQRQKYISYRMLYIFSMMCVVAKDKYQYNPSQPYYSLTLNENDVSPGYTKLSPSPPLHISSSFDKMQSSMSSTSPVDTSIKTVICKQEPILAVSCKCWPKSALPWKTRQRLEGWPTAEFIESAVDDGCFVLLGKQHKKLGSDSDTEYELCFAVIEKRIFKEVTSPHQKHVYIMFRALCQQTMIDMEKLSRPAKAVFFYACELIPSEQWATRQGACVLYMLDQLAEGLNTGTIPDYFIPSRNVLDELDQSDIEDQFSKISLLRSQPLLFLQQIQETCCLQIKGDAIIEKVSADIPSFTQHRKPQKSVVDTFVPATIMIAKESIKKRKYKEGLSILSNAFEERLSVSTCNDSISYQMFLCGALGDLDLRYSVWFAVYADFALIGQLSVSMVQELCAHSTLTKITDIVPEDVAGEYAQIQLPSYMCQNAGKFCLDFAKFLYCSEKIPAALPVLLFCYEKYKQQTVTHTDACSVSNGVNVDDRVMLEVFVAILKLYKHQGKEGQFKAMMEDAEVLCRRLNTVEATSTFALFCMHTTMIEKLEVLLSREDISQQVQIQLRCFAEWPEW